MLQQNSFSYLKAGVDRAIKLRYTADIASSYVKYNKANRFEFPAVICLIYEALARASDNNGERC